MYLIGHNRIIPLAVFHGVVSGEFADQRRPLADQRRPLADQRRPLADQRRPLATGNGLTSLTAPMILSLRSAGANLTSIGEVLLWGYVDDPMSLREKATKMAFSIEEAPCGRTGFFTRRGRSTHVMVATLKRPPRMRRPQ